MKNKIILTLLSVVISLASHAQKTKTENVILITLDGMRWQEVFSGAEQRLIKKKFTKDSAVIVNTYWATTPEARREKLMPFFWKTIAKQGQLYGNRNLGSKVNTANKMWFSYPGYNEILCGFADDEKINSNDANDNPNKNVLEFLNEQKDFKGRIAAYTSWETFPWIINTKRNGIPVNSGLTKSQNPNESEKLLDELMFQLPNNTGGTRVDALTFHYAFEYLKKNRPKVLFLSFDETDHWAHEGEYDKYLHAANYTDGFIKTLWEWLQSQPQYKNKTTVIITTDHGRGKVNDEDWKHHGAKMPFADEIWFAFLGPDTPALGEIKSEQQLFQNQVAKSLAAFLGVDYKNEKQVGGIVSTAFTK
jgi:membrane-anchored protein YejM (alkaline phosphatase superfamily)